VQLTDKQKQLIHLAIAQLGIDEETYRMMLRERFDVATCTKLQYSEASAFIDDLVKKGFRIKSRRIPPRPKAPNVVYLPSSQQLTIIEHLRRHVKWRVHDGYYRWIEKFLGRRYIKTSREAQKVIEALKAMENRQQAEFVKRCHEANREEVTPGR
jgi:hypothetical protein